VRRLKNLIRRWNKFTIGTWNVGPGTIENALALMAMCDVLCFQEASDQGKMKDALRKAGYVVIDPDAEPGQAAVFICVNPKTVDVRRTYSVELLDKQYIGRGAGPDYNKPKWLHVAVLHHKATGRRVIVGATHVVPSQYNAERLRAAIRMNALTEHEMDDFHAATFICADWNAEPDDKSMEVWGDTGWHSVMVDLGWLDTHGHRTIDDILFRVREWVRLVKHRIVKNRSDHNAHIVTFMLKRK
jgi:endonuclease/exonuclease/phosphatase family metal-dependent hydrolase